MDYPWNHHPPPPPGNPNLFPSPQIPHYQNPSFQSLATYSHHRPQIPYNQNPNLDHRGYHNGVAYSPFDLGYERPRPDEFGVAADQNPCFQSPIAYNQNPNLDYRSYNGDVSYPPFDRGYKRAREDDLGVGNNYNPTLHKPQIARNQSHNPEYRNYNDGAGYSPFDHGYERPRPKELSVGDNERRLKLIRDHGGTESMSVNGEIREDFPESSGLKRPRFDELSVGKSFTAMNMNTHDEINGYHDKKYEPLVRNDSLTLSHDIRSNLPPNYGIHSHGHFNESAFGHNVLPTSFQVSSQSGLIFENNSNIGVAPGSNIQPSRPVAPPTPFRMDPQGPLFSDQHTPSSQAKVSSLFPISVTPMAPKDTLQFPQTFAKEFQPVTQRLCMNYPSEGQHFPLILSNKPKAVDASHIFKQPHRATRPDYIVVILRGLPGSGKSYLAKMMRDLEVDNGGKAPRIHSMDDYFMTEVEKIEESDNLKSSGSSRAKKSVVKMVMEYCYEAEMEEAYRSSMLKTFKKTLDEGAFPLVIVDDRNLRVADFAQFWATAKRSGYEVYLLEAMYKDPVGCAARNVHGFTLDDIQKMADQWEEAPSLYLKLDAKSLLNGDDLKENDIQEVDMDTEDGPSEDALSGSAERNSDNLAPITNQLSASGPPKANDHWNAESDHIREEVKELGRSKWSNDLDDDNSNNKEASAVNPSVCAIVKAKTKEGKSVHWGDQGANIGFSIGAAKRVNTSLVIGAGSGYNSKSNPLPEDVVSPGSGGKLNHQSVFQERIRAEHESFRAVFDKRRHRIGGLDLDEE